MPPHGVPKHGGLGGIYRRKVRLHHRREFFRHILVHAVLWQKERDTDIHRERVDAKGEGKGSWHDVSRKSMTLALYFFSPPLFLYSSFPTSNLHFSTSIFHPRFLLQTFDTSHFLFSRGSVCPTTTTGFRQLIREKKTNQAISAAHAENACSQNSRSEMIAKRSINRIIYLTVRHTSKNHGMKPMVRFSN